MIAGLLVGSGGVIGYLASDHPTAAGAVEIIGAVVLAVLVTAALVVRSARPSNQ